MSNTSKAFVALGLVAFAAACAPREPEPVYVPPAPVQAEPVYSKYGGPVGGGYGGGDGDDRFDDGDDRFDG